MGHTRGLLADETAVFKVFVCVSVNRNPDEEAGKEEKKHSQPGLQRPVRARSKRAKKRCDRL